MRRRYTEIQSSGGEVVIVSFESTERLAQLARQMQLPFTLLSDPPRDTYAAYGLIRGSWRQIFGARTIWSYLQLLLRGRKYHFLGSDLRQLGGDFVIDSEGIVRFEHRGAQPSDRPSVEQLLGELSKV